MFDRVKVWAILTQRVAIECVCTINNSCVVMLYRSCVVHDRQYNITLFISFGAELVCPDRSPRIENSIAGEQNCVCFGTAQRTMNALHFAFEMNNYGTVSQLYTTRIHTTGSNAHHMNPLQSKHVRNDCTMCQHADFLLQSLQQ